MNRAISTLAIRSVDEEQRIIRGIATTPTEDRVSDIIEPLGCTFTNPAPLLWAHLHDQPVGTVVFDKPTAAGVTFTARFPKVAEPGLLKDRVDHAFQCVKSGLISSVSIGFRVIGDAVERLRGGGHRYLKTEILELSLVSVPAQPDARILDVKHAKSRSRRLPVVRLTAADIRRGELLLAAKKRAEARARVGIPHPVVRLNDAELRRGKSILASSAGGRGRVVKI